MRLRCFETGQAATEWVANEISLEIKGFLTTEQHPYFVLGLPTGETPLPIYREWVRQYRSQSLSFEQVVTFNMDEYVGLAQSDPRSYHYYMQSNFFEHVDLPKTQRNLFNGLENDWRSFCEAYEEKITSYGAVDTFLGGVGEDGHIAFNEPGSAFHSSTRRVRLTQSTRQANARFFGGDIAAVPTHALTVGLGTLLRSRRLILVALGERKAEAVQRAIQEPMHHLCPLSIIQWHANLDLVCDRAAVASIEPTLLSLWVSENKG